MSITSAQNNKGAKKGNKQLPANAQNSKFITKPGGTASSFVKKKITTGSRRGG